MSPPSQSVSVSGTLLHGQGRFGKAEKAEVFFARIDREEQGTEYMENHSNSSTGATSGPLRIYKDGERLFVTGFGLKFEVESEEEGRQLIAELEEQGYRICY